MVFLLPRTPQHPISLFMNRLSIPLTLSFLALASTVMAGDLQLLGDSQRLAGSPQKADAPPRILLAGFTGSDEGASADLNITVLPVNYKVVRKATLMVNPFSRFPWKKDIVTTVFWIGEEAGQNNPVANRESSWDHMWRSNYGGIDTPNPLLRVDFHPKGFIPRQNPFYIALPYNDVTRGSTKAEAPTVIPWFAKSFERVGQTVCKGRWLAIRKGDRTAYAQWEDCGPFRTDHWQYVFGNERPKPNLNAGAGLDVSPAIRDYLGLEGTDVTDWRFVEEREVPPGPWRSFGDNNPFVNPPMPANEIAANDRMGGDNPLFAPVTAYTNGRRK
jgi:hypothetical protein